MLIAAFSPTTPAFILPEVILLFSLAATFSSASPILRFLFALSLFHSLRNKMEVASSLWHTQLFVLLHIHALSGPNPSSICRFFVFFCLSGPVPRRIQTVVCMSLSVSSRSIYMKTERLGSHQSIGQTELKESYSLARLTQSAQPAGT